MVLSSSGIFLTRSRFDAIVLGISSRCQGSMTVVAHSGSNPTMDRTLSLVACSVGSAKDVVVEAVLLIPHSVLTGLVHRRGDPEEVFHELRGHLIVDRIVTCQNLLRAPPCSG